MYAPRRARRVEVRRSEVRAHGTDDGVNRAVGLGVWPVARRKVRREEALPIGVPALVELRRRGEVSELTTPAQGARESGSTYLPRLVETHCRVLRRKDLRQEGLRKRPSEREQRGRAQSTRDLLRPSFRSSAARPHRHPRQRCGSRALAHRRDRAAPTRRLRRQGGCLLYTSPSPRDS